MVRLDKAVAQQLEAERNGKSMSATAERLLKLALNNPKSDDEAANRALGYILSQAAFASSWKDRTWQSDPATAAALKLALPAIVDLLAGHEAVEPKRHPYFKSTEEHARSIFAWVLNRLRERGDEYGTDWPADHPLRNFPKAANAIGFKKGDEA